MTMTGSGTRVPDYVAIGHLTIDHTPAGDALGGTVLYAALTAARYGVRAAVLTRANIPEMSESLQQQIAEIAQEIEIVIQAGDTTTTFTNREIAGRRSQVIHSWAGEIDLNGLPPLWRSARVIHLAPIAQEIAPRQLGRLAPQLLGATPQGWMREWRREQAGQVRQIPLRLPADVMSRIDALVISSEEYVNAREVVEEVGRRGLAAVTRSQLGTTLIDRGREVQVPAYRVHVVDTLGAGDVFAGGLFAARSERQSVAASARYASAAASLAVTGRGVQAVPTREQVEALIEQGKPARS